MKTISKTLNEVSKKMQPLFKFLINNTPYIKNSPNNLNMKLVEEKQASFLRIVEMTVFHAFEELELLELPHAKSKD